MTTLVIAEDAVRDEVTANRQSEIERYIGLFGYRPDQTMLQVHLAGPPKKGASPRAGLPVVRSVRMMPAVFTALGRTHDPVLGFRLLRSGGDSEDPRYLGYLFGPKDEGMRPPHELLPLDFTPLELEYPSDWEKMFGTVTFVVGMRVPSSFAQRTRVLHTRMRRIGGAFDVKKKWDFIGELEEFARRI